MEPIPPFVEPLLGQVNEWLRLNYLDCEANQEYPPGIGVSPHVEHPDLGPIVATASLMGEYDMDFHPVSKGKPLTFRLHKGSLSAIFGELRDRRRHGIASRQADIIDGVVTPHT